MEKRGGTMGKPGSVSWNFEQKAIYVLNAEGVDEDALMETALDAGADDLQGEAGLEGEAGFFTVTGAPDTFASIGRALTDAGYTVENADVTFIPKEKIMLAPDEAKKLINIIDAVEDLDDVSNAITNGDIPDEVLAELGG
jgi:transcriptional/translational regulatory protein YebC/TACO1